MSTVPTSKGSLFSVWNIIKIALAAILLWFVLSKVNLVDLVATLANASVVWLAVSAVLFVVMTLLKTLQYHVLMRSKLTYPQVLSVIIWQNAVSNFLLTGAGIATYVTMTRLEHDVKISRSMIIFLLVKLGDLVAIWLGLLISGSLLWGQISYLQIPIVSLLAGIGFVLLAFLFTVFFRQRFVLLVQKTFDKLGLSRINIVERGTRVLGELAEMDQTNVLMVFSRLLLYSLVYLFVTLLWGYANLAIFHLYMEPAPLVFVGVLSQLISYFPVAVFGGLGLTETSSLYFWSFFNFSPEVLAPVMIGIRVVFYLLNVLPLIYLPMYALRRKSKDRTAL